MPSARGIIVQSVNGNFTNGSSEILRETRLTNTRAGRHQDEPTLQTYRICAALETRVFYDFLTWAVPGRTPTFTASSATAVSLWCCCDAVGDLA